MSLEAGQTLSHYRLIEKIGEGGMGVVWKAFDTKLDREVAVKLLPEDLASDPERLRRFEREAKAAAAINHPNIVTLYSVEDAEGTHFIAMELVEGRTLTRAGIVLGTVPYMSPEQLQGTPVYHWTDIFALGIVL